MAMRQPQEEGLGVFTFAVGLQGRDVILNGIGPGRMMALWKGRAGRIGGSLDE